MNSFSSAYLFSNETSQVYVQYTAELCTSFKVLPSNYKKDFDLQRVETNPQTIELFGAFYQLLTHVPSASPKNLKFHEKKGCLSKIDKLSRLLLMHTAFSFVKKFIMKFTTKRNG